VRPRPGQIRLHRHQLAGIRLATLDPLLYLQFLFIEASAERLRGDGRKSNLTGRPKKTADFLNRSGIGRGIHPNQALRGPRKCDAKLIDRQPLGERVRCRKTPVVHDAAQQRTAVHDADRMKVQPLSLGGREHERQYLFRQLGLVEGNQRKSFAP